MAKRKTLDVQALVDNYRSGTSALRLAADTGVSLNTVLRRLRESGVEIRKTERQPYRRLDLTPGSEKTLREIVDGLLLGDGSLTRDGSLRLPQCVRRAAWLDEVQQLLQQVAVPARVIPVPVRSKAASIQGREIRITPSRLLYTPHFWELRQHHLRWYGTGRKSPPADLHLTPLVVSLWFCGDGSYHANGSLQFCTNSFSESGVRYLIGLLGGVGVVSTTQHTADGPVIAVYRRDAAQRLKDYMGALVPEVFRYKLAHVRSAIPRGRSLRTLAEEDVREIRRLHTGRNGAELGRRFGVSSVTISKIVRKLIYQDL